MPEAEKGADLGFNSGLKLPASLPPGDYDMEVSVVDTLAPKKQQTVTQWVESTLVQPGGSSAWSNTYITVAGADILFVLTGNQVGGAPEPGSLALMAGAAAMLAVLRRCRVSAPNRRPA